MITRKGLADEIDQIDEAIKAYNESKREAFDAYRDQLIAAGVAKPNVKIEIEAVKAAIRRRRAVRKDEAAEIEKSELIDEIFDEITTVARAPRAHEENIEKFDREARAKRRTSQAMDDNIAFSAQMLADGLISEEAHAENIALSNAVAMKLGAGVIDPETGEILDDIEASAGTAPAVETSLAAREAEESAVSNSEIATASQGGTASPSPDAELSSAGANAGGGHVKSSAERASVANVASGPDEKQRATNSPEQANEVPAQDGEGTGLGESLSGKSDAAHPVSEQELAETVLNDGKAAGETAVEVVTAGETATNSIAKPKYVLRPHCLNPGETCGGYSDKHCHACSVAMRKREQAEEVA
ncbi:hypothetical protein HB772_07460 [Sinorhizobium meliloti]|nr:hypothetical protein HB772_07460 [Sinorhizobium meliloti]